ncbi:hypothetical protein RJ639_005259 [Escallonia herrerae]|uniref:Protein Jade-1 n=1 Tax=Escallonia herrerae TaxID=1293975 RepID=A0AA88W2W3_9ASTE|nr:hypothetical protein RJ639_005259 [Escallonia herrerae]
MENKFHSLPPLKRFRVMQQHEHHHEETQINTVSPPCLPAKKRKRPPCPPPSPPPPFTPNSSTTTTYCLPAKKRIWAFQPQTYNSPFDLNIEYNPLFDEEKDDISNQEERKRVESEGEEEDGILCAVCKSTDGDPKDPIVFCDGCDLMVHTTCYGSPLTDGVPDGDWFCSKCLNKKDCFSCCLCPVTDGAMKSTTDNRWAHIVCALFVPEVFFCDPDGREGIDCSKVPAWRWEKSCYVCDGGKGNGCVIDCSEPKCRLSFHVTCGLKEELCIEYRERRKKGVIVAGFCKSHTDLWDKQQQTGKFKIVARDEHRN